MWEGTTCVVVVHIWLLQKLINHMWEGTLTDVGLQGGFNGLALGSSCWLEPINREGLAPQSG